MRVFIALFLVYNICTFAYTKEDVANAKYLAEKGIIKTQDTTAGYKLKDVMARAEVIGLTLRIRGITVPSNYTCKNYFSDTKHDPENTWVCPVIEIAADNKIISRDNKQFRPLEPATKVEALGMIIRAAGLAIKQEGAASYNKIDTIVDTPTAWKRDLLLSGFMKGVISPLETTKKGEIVSMKFDPEQKATRAMVISFIKNTLPFQINKKYTIAPDDVCAKKPTGIQKVKLSGKNLILNLFPLPLKNAFSGSYILRNDVITYIAKKVSENDILLGSYIYQYNCAEKTTKNLSSSLISGTSASMEIEDVGDAYILTRIYTGQTRKPGSAVFYIYKISEGKGSFIQSSAFAGIEKYKKSPDSRYLTTVEALRLNKDIMEAKVVVNDMGENLDPTSTPEYSVISEKWVQWDTKTSSLK